MITKVERTEREKIENLQSKILFRFASAMHALDRLAVKAKTDEEVSRYIEQSAAIDYVFKTYAEVLASETLTLDLVLEIVDILMLMGESSDQNYGYVLAASFIMDYIN